MLLTHIIFNMLLFLVQEPQFIFMKTIKYDNVLHYAYVSVRKGELITLQGSLKTQKTVLISQLSDSLEAFESPGNKTTIFIKLSLSHSH